MIHETKLMFIGCAVALIVGASIVSPLLILHTSLNPFPENPPLHPNPQSSQSQIALTLKSVSIGVGTYESSVQSNSSETVTKSALTGKITVSATKYLNDNKNITDGEVDYFLFEIFTENGVPLQQEALFIGTAYNESFTYEKQVQISSQFLRQTFDINASGGGTFFYTWSIGTTNENGQGFTSSIPKSTAASLGNAQTLTMTLSRVGTVTVRGDSTVVSTSDAGLIETVTLIRSGNTFVYNK